MLCGFQEDDLPIFGRIDDIMVVTSTPMFSIRLFTTLGINNHLLNYAIEHAHCSTLILISQLIYPEPLSPYQRIGDDNVYNCFAVAGSKYYSFIVVMLPSVLIIICNYNNCIIILTL